MVGDVDKAGVRRDPLRPAPDHGVLHLHGAAAFAADQVVVVLGGVAVAVEELAAV